MNFCGILSRIMAFIFLDFMWISMVGVRDFLVVVDPLLGLRVGHVTEQSMLSSDFWNVLAVTQPELVI